MSLVRDVTMRELTADLFRALKQHPGDPLRSIGSISLVKSMMQVGLVDRLRPIVLEYRPACPGTANPATSEGFPW